MQHISKSDGAAMARYPYPARIKAKLHIFGKTQRELAAELGYTPGYISHLLTANCVPQEMREKIEIIFEKWEAENE